MDYVGIGQRYEYGQMKMKQDRGMTKLRQIEQEAEDGLAFRAGRFFTALADRHFAALLLVEKAFLRDWQRREAAHSALCSAHEVLPGLS